MHVARLRQKLAEYYRTEGAADPIVLDLPKGGFKMVFEARPALAPPPNPNPDQSSRKCEAGGSQKERCWLRS